MATGHGERGAATGVDGTAQFVGKEVSGALGRIVVDLDRRFTRTFSHDSIMARFAVPAAGYSFRHDDDRSDCVDSADRPPLA